MKKKSKQRASRRSKECVTHVMIHFRDFGQSPPASYCVQVDCQTHHSTWCCITDTFEHAGKLGHSFPLVWGGLAMGAECFPIPDECLLGKIPRKPSEETGEGVTK